jgi:hypothetical protein
MSDVIETASHALCDVDDLEARPALPPADFDLARHNIDLLAVLQLKTKGNLTTEEQRALDNSVTELRFRFVQVQQGESKPA